MQCLPDLYPSHIQSAYAFSIDFSGLPVLSGNQGLNLLKGPKGDTGDTGPTGAPFFLYKPITRTRH
ncbi:MAG TPA: hypothetical protein VN704_11635 [Verrucomicrobiae bacterium]|nr:hypothetical protein [Verrucomicrobiae bacterium]